MSSGSGFNAGPETQCVRVARHLSCTLIPMFGNPPETLGTVHSPERPLTRLYSRPDLFSITACLPIGTLLAGPTSDPKTAPPALSVFALSDLTGAERGTPLPPDPAPTAAPAVQGVASYSRPTLLRCYITLTILLYFTVSLLDLVEILRLLGTSISN